MIIYRLLSVAAGIAVASSALAQWQIDPPEPKLGIEVGAYFLQDARMRDIFGDAIPKLGLTAMGKRNERRNRFYNSLSYVGASRDGSKFALVPYTFGYQAAFVRDLTAQTIPYVRAEVGIAYMDYAINTGFGRVSSKRLGPTAAVEAGIRLTERLQVAGRYNWFAEYDNFDFNGFQISLSYAITGF